MTKLPADAFTRDAACEAGYTLAQIRYRVASGEWTELLSGVYAHTATELTPMLWRRAALLWAGKGAVLSHRSAAALWKLEGVREQSPELIVPSKRNVVEVQVHQRTDLVPTDTTFRDGVRCTNPTRTIIDLASVLDEETLEAAFESARRQNLTTVAAVRERQLSLGTQGRRGSKQLLQLLNELDGNRATESILEVKVARLLRRTGLPVPRRQYEVVIFGRRYRLDFAWPELRIALECDGKAFHEFQRDRTRWRHLGASGWLVLPVTWADVTKDWAVVVYELTEAISRAATAR
jgi:very-short-patch-repair endonuclease